MSDEQIPVMINRLHDPDARVLAVAIARDPRFSLVPVSMRDQYTPDTATTIDGQVVQLVGWPGQQTTYRSLPAGTIVVDLFVDNWQRPALASIALDTGHSVVTVLEGAERTRLQRPHSPGNALTDKLLLRPPYFNPNYAPRILEALALFGAQIRQGTKGKVFSLKELEAANMRTYTLDLGRAVVQDFVKPADRSSEMTGNPKLHAEGDIAVFLRHVFGYDFSAMRVDPKRRLVYTSISITKPDHRPDYVSTDSYFRDLKRCPHCNTSDYLCTSRGQTETTKDTFNEEVSIDLRWIPEGKAVSDKNMPTVTVTFQKPSTSWAQKDVPSEALKARQVIQVSGSVETMQLLFGNDQLPTIEQMMRERRPTPVRRVLHSADGASLSERPPRTSKTIVYGTKDGHVSKADFKNTVEPLDRNVAPGPGVALVTRRERERAEFLARVERERAERGPGVRLPYRRRY